MIFKAMRFKQGPVRSAFILAIVRMAQAVFESRLRDIAEPGPLTIEGGREHLGRDGILGLQGARLVALEGNTEEAKIQRRRNYQLRWASGQLRLSRLFVVCHRLWWYLNPGGKTIHAAMDVGRHGGR